MGRNSKDNSLRRFEDMVLIATRYNDYLYHPRIQIGLSSKSHKPFTEAVKYIRNVKRVLKELKKDDRELIMSEFFSLKYNPRWWVKKFSKSTYYRRRYIAVKNFMEIYSQ